MQNNIAIKSDSLISDKQRVPHTFNKIARRYDLATYFSQGYSKDLKHSVKLMNLQVFIGDENR